jgi:RNA polymerase primary sigma factor
MATKKMQNSSNDENSLSIYLKEINKIPLLTREEEEAAARLAAKGNKAAKLFVISA